MDENQLLGIYRPQGVLMPLGIPNQEQQVIEVNAEVIDTTIRIHILSKVIPRLLR